MKRRLVTLVAVVSLAAMSLAGCSSKKAKETEPATTAQVQETKAEEKETTAPETTAPETEAAAVEEAAAALQTEAEAAAEAVKAAETEAEAAVAEAAAAVETEAEAAADAVKEAAAAAETEAEAAVEAAAAAVETEAEAAADAVKEAVAAAETEAEAAADAVKEAVAAAETEAEAAADAVKEAVAAAETEAEAAVAEAAAAVETEAEAAADALKEAVAEAETELEEAVGEVAAAVETEAEEAVEAVKDVIAALAGETEAEAVDAETEAEALDAETEAEAADAETEAEAAPSELSSAAAPEWDSYNEKIAKIYTETDPAKREALMHEAEDQLMDTWAVVPIYYYNDIYMQTADIENIYSNVFGFKYFAYATAPDNEMNVNLASEPDHLDPALNSSVDGACLAILGFSGLYAYDAEGQLVPELAEKEPEVSEDGLTYVFTLRDGLKWSDGEDLDANDIVYSWNRFYDPNTAADYSYLIDSSNIGVKEDGTLDIEASEDGKTFTVHLTNPCAYFLDLCAFPAFYPVPEQAVTEADPDGSNPGAWSLEAGFVTSGPFTCTEWKHNESMVYEKNPNYWNADAVSLEKINFMLSADDTAIFNAYKDGSLQFIDTVPTDEIANVKDQDDFYIVPNLGTYYVGFNVNSELFDGMTPQQAADMRHALCLLIDRQYIVDTVGQTGQELASTFIPTGMADGNGGEFRANDDDYTYPDEEAVGYYDASATGADMVDEAVELLKGAGFEFNDDNTLSDETPIHLTYLTNDSDAHVKIAESMQQDFALIGVTMDIESKDWQVVLNERKEGQFDVAREGWLADYNDPINMLEMWLTNSGNNDMQFGR